MLSVGVSTETFKRNMKTIRSLRVHSNFFGITELQSDIEERLFDNSCKKLVAISKFIFKLLFKMNMSLITIADIIYKVAVPTETILYRVI